MPEPSKAFLNLAPGQPVLHQGRLHRVTHQLTLDTILARDLESNEIVRLRVDALASPGGAEGGETPSAPPDLALLTDTEWSTARKRLQAIQPLLEGASRDRALVERIARENDTHPATVYRWLKLYLASGYLSALVPSRPGRKAGSHRLSPEQEIVLRSVVDDARASRKPARLRSLIAEANSRFRLSVIPSPHPNTIRRRLEAELGAPRLGTLSQAPAQLAQGESECPLALVQIAFVELDTVLVDAIERRPVGRPWLALAIDRYSRMIVGCHLSFSPPGADSIGLCVAHAISTKGDYLSLVGVDGEWPAWGVMRKLCAEVEDGIRLAFVQRACEERLIETEWIRPRSSVGADHLAVLMGPDASRLRALASGNDGKRRGARPSLTLREFEKLLADFIVNTYHLRRHPDLGASPRSRWDLGIFGDKARKGCGLPPLPVDPLRLRLDFLPALERSIQRYGIRIDHINYNAPLLAGLAGQPEAKPPRKFLIRRDPSDISQVYLYHPEERRYHAIPWRDSARPAMTVHELHEVLRRLEKEEPGPVTEEAIFRRLAAPRPAAD